MHILYFLNTIGTTGGIERIVIEKVNYLANLNGFQVTMAYFGSDQTVPFFKIDKRVKRKTISSGYGGSSIINRFWRIYKIRKQVKIIIDETKPDIIENANMALVSWILPFMSRNIPKVIELHSSRIGKKIFDRVIFGERRWVNWIIDYFRCRFYAFYDKSVMLTEEGIHEYNLKNSVVIPNFTNIQLTGNVASNKGEIAINVGRLSYQKNQKLLIDAWNIVHAKEPKWRLEIWGDGELKDSLVNQIKTLELDDVVILRGNTKQIEKVYGQSSFFILSSRYEGQPLVMIEALQAGLPCVCIAVNGVRGTIRNDYNGYVVEQETPEALADGILKMIHCDDWKTLSENARESAKVFDKELVMGMWIRLFKDLTNENHH